MCSPVGSLLTVTVIGIAGVTGTHAGVVTGRTGATAMTMAGTANGVGIADQLTWPSCPSAVLQGPNAMMGCSGPVCCVDLV